MCLHNCVPCRFCRGAESPVAGSKGSTWVGASACIRKAFKLPYSLLKLTCNLTGNEKLRIVVGLSPRVNQFPSLLVMMPLWMSFQ